MDLYIIGAGDVGGYIAYNANEKQDYNIMGFIDDNPQKWGNLVYGFKVLGGVDILEDIKEDIAVVIAISSPTVKEIIYNKIKHYTNISFPNFVHSTVWLGKDARLGIGNILYPGSTINFETTIEDFVIINMNSSIGHNCRFERFSTVSPSVSCGGFTVLKKGAFLGINSTTIQSTMIGEYAVVGAGSVVIKNVPERVTVVGNPARVLPNKNIQS